MESHGPIVYAGPSLPREDVLEILPQSLVKPPIRRGDLYRERTYGGSFFVILDGVFSQEFAIPPREILDVVQDGALVVGASSMGALRAAECWPAGMRGVGSIYRLFRKGSLHSDDEVALTFDPGDDHRPLSLPLVNVRHALRRAVRLGVLGGDDAVRLAGTAQQIFYPERSWTKILERAGIRDRDGELVALLEGFDLKRQDARRALYRVARWLMAEPGLLRRPRAGDGRFRPSEEIRERDADPLVGRDLARWRRQLAHWHLTSGRYTRHLRALLAADPELSFSDLARRKQLQATLLVGASPAARGTAAASPDETPELKEMLIGPAAVELALFDLWTRWLTNRQSFADALWGVLTLTGELHGEILRWRAVQEATAEVRRRGLAVTGLDVFAAEAEIAHAHGFPAWIELKRAVSRTEAPWSWFTEARDALAPAKSLSRDLFKVPV